MCCLLFIFHSVTLRPPSEGPSGQDGLNPGQGKGLLGLNMSAGP